MRVRKKWLAAILAVLLVFSMAACGSKNAAEEAAKKLQSGGTAKQDSDDFVRGVLKEGAYESQALSVGFTLGEDWSAASVEELAQLSGVDTTDLSEAEMVEQMVEADAIFDFYAMSGDGLTLVQVIYEDLGVLYGTLLDEDGYLNVVGESVEEEMAAAGMTDVESTETTVTFAGQERPGLFICSEMQVEGVDQSIEIYQKLVPIKAGNYMAVAWAVTYLEDNTDTVVENFYALP